MKVEYKNKKLKKVCTIASVTEKAYSRQMADKIQQRIAELESAETVEELMQFHIGRCHPLHQNRENQYAMDLVHPMRLVFEKKGDEIQIAEIVEIVDYH